jgi:hypothetical protein
VAVVLPVATAHAINPFGRSGFELTNSDVPLLTEATRPFFEDNTFPSARRRAEQRQRAATARQPHRPLPT